MISYLLKISTFWKESVSSSQKITNSGTKKGLDQNYSFSYTYEEALTPYGRSASSSRYEDKTSGTSSGNWASTTVDSNGTTYRSATRSLSFAATHTQTISLFTTSETTSSIYVYTVGETSTIEYVPTGSSISSTTTNSSGSQSTSVVTTGFTWVTATTLFLGDSLSHSITKRIVTQHSTETIPNGATVEWATVMLADAGEGLALVTATGINDASQLCGDSTTSLYFENSKALLSSTAPTTNTDNWTLESSVTNVYVTWDEGMYTTSRVIGESSANLLPTPTLSDVVFLPTYSNQISVNETTFQTRGVVTIGGTALKTSSTTFFSILKSGTNLTRAVVSSSTVVPVVGAVYATPVTVRGGVSSGSSMGSSKSWFEALPVAIKRSVPSPVAIMAQKEPHFALATGSSEGDAITGVTASLPSWMIKEWGSSGRYAIVQFPTSISVSYYTAERLMYQYSESSITISVTNFPDSSSFSTSGVLGLSGSVDAQLTYCAASNLPAQATVGLYPGVYISQCGTSSGRFTVTEVQTFQWSRAVAVHPVNKAFAAIKGTGNTFDKAFVSAAVPPNYMNQTYWWME